MKFYDYLEDQGKSFPKDTVDSLLSLREKNYQPPYIARFLGTDAHNLSEKQIQDLFNEYYGYQGFLKKKETLLKDLESNGVQLVGVEGRHRLSVGSELSISRMSFGLVPPIPIS